MLIGVRASQLTFTNPANYFPPAQYADEIFHCIFGPAGNHVTTALDISPIAAPLSFHGAAEISTGAAGLTFPQHPLWPSALLCPSNGSYVEAPHHPAYDQLGQGDFTIEFFLAPDTAVNPAGPIQWIGVWGGAMIADQHWRLVTDINSYHFQWVQGGAMREIAWRSTVANASVWLKVIFERYLGSLKFWIQFGGGISLIATVPFTGAMDVPANPTPLRIGGTPALSSLAYMREVRITKAAQYRGLAPPLQNAPFGWLFPDPVTDFEVIPSVRMGQVLATPVVDAETFFAPVVKQDKLLRPARVIDVDNFLVPLNSLSQFFVGPAYPEVSLASDVGYPKFEEQTVTSGNGFTATLTLPATRNPGDIMLAVIQFGAGTFPPNTGVIPTMANGSSAGGGAPLGRTADWYFSNAFRSTCGVASHALRMVDGTEAAPVFNWSSAQSRPWVGRILRISGCDTSIWPIWDQSFFCSYASRAQSRGWFNFNHQSDNFFDAGAPPEPNGLHMKLVMTNNDQVIPNSDPHYTTVLQDHSAGGSVMIAVRKAQAVNNDNFGSGTIDEPILLALNEADIFTFNGPYP